MKKTRLSNVTKSELANALLAAYKNSHEPLDDSPEVRNYIFKVLSKAGMI